MRISSNMMFENNIAAITQQQTRVFQTQQQLATGTRILKPSDDPIAATRVLELTQADAANAQFTENRNMATQTLTMADSALNAITSLLQDVRTAAVSAGNPSFGASERKVLATSLNIKLQDLAGLANSTDGLGNYLFAGFQTRTQPFIDAPSGITYIGDDGQRNIQVSASFQMATSDSGAEAFMRIKNGNGTFIALPGVTNTGGGVVSKGMVVDAALLTSNNYEISFSVVAGVTTFDITNTTTSAVVSAGNPYISGQVINFDGLQLDIKGTPANGDVFNITSSANESVFKTISDLVSALNTPVVGANLSNSLLRGIGNLDNALEKIVSSRSSIGLRLNEIDTLQVVGDDLGLQFKSTLSQLQDTNYSKAASDLAQQNLILQAAQQSFAKVASLSIFNYL